MDFNFREQYKTYSNVELLKIIERPADYQRTAVMAAQEVLNEREVSVEDRALSTQYLLEMEHRQQWKQERKPVKTEVAEFFGALVRRDGDAETKAWVSDFMGSDTKEDIQAKRWAYVILGISVLQYLWFLFHVVRIATLTIEYAHSNFTSQMYLNFISVLYTPVVLYLFYKRKRWGWILEFADKLIPGIMVLCQAYAYVMYMRATGQGSALSFILPILYSGIFIFLLWNNRIARYFGISARVKKITLGVVTAIALLFIVAVYTVSYMYE